MTDVLDKRDMSAPAGWKIVPFEDAYQEVNGPYFLKEDFEATEEEPLRFGFRVGEHNCNFNGTCHGGMIAATLDIAMGRSMHKATGADVAPTISMSIDFMRAGMPGDWIESRVRILRKTRSMIFVDATLVGPQGTVARGNAVFKVLTPRG